MENTNIVFEQFELIRGKGDVNMTDFVGVMCEAFGNSCFDLVVRLANIQESNNGSAEYAAFLEEFSKYAIAKQA